MGLFDRIEKRLDRSVHGALSRASRGSIDPLALAQAVRKECDDRAAIIDRDRTVVPNEYTIVMHHEDHEGFASWQDTLVDELEQMLVGYADKQGYSFVGPVRVFLKATSQERAGRFQVFSATVQGRQSVAEVREIAQRQPIIDIEGQQYLLTGDVTLIGRGSDCDIILEDSGVSRHHLEIRVNPDRISVADLGSTNGSKVNGHVIQGEVRLKDNDEIILGRTTIYISFPQSSVH